MSQGNILMTATPRQSRAEAARANGARSRGPKTAAGKARSAQNALKHGLTASRFIVLPEEDPAAFEATLAMWIEALVPVGPLQHAIVQTIAVADWRLERANRLEHELFADTHLPRDDGRNPLALSVQRDGHSARALPTLLRYRAGATAEIAKLMKLLAVLKAQAEDAKRTRDQLRAEPPPADPPPAQVTLARAACETTERTRDWQKASPFTPAPTLFAPHGPNRALETLFASRPAAAMRLMQGPGAGVLPLVGPG
jgi:hypothetical protein